MEIVRMLYAKRDNTRTSRELIPVSYYDTEVFKNRVERYKENLKNYFKGKEVILNRLKREPAYDMEMQNSVSENVFFKVQSIHSIVRERESPLVEKINLTNGGQIEIKIDAQQMSVCSRRYGQNQISYSVSKRLKPGLTPEESLIAEERNIFNRMANIELMKRKRELYNGLISYQKKQEDSKKKQWNQLFEQIGGGIDPEIVAAIHEMERDVA